MSYLQSDSNLAKVLNTVEKLSRDSHDNVALLSKSIDAATVAMTMLVEHFVSTFANKDTDNKKFTLDLFKVLLSKRERSDEDDTDDDAGVKPPARKKSKRN